MGRARIEISVIGDHGCGRDFNEVGPICDKPGCIDCLTKKFLIQLKQNNNVEQALLIHWPENGTIVDNLLDSKRSGSFK